MSDNKLIPRNIEGWRSRTKREKVSYSPEGEDDDSNESESGNRNRKSRSAGHYSPRKVLAEGEKKARPAFEIPLPEQVLGAGTNLASRYVSLGISLPVARNRQNARVAPVPKPKKKRGVPKRMEERKGVVKKYFPKVEVEQIQWVALPKERRFSLNYKDARYIIKWKRLDINRSRYPSLYSNFIRRLDFLTGGNTDVPELLLLSLKYTGVFPGKKREFGNFGKVNVLGEDFVLPVSFFKNCRKALTASTF